MLLKDAQSIVFVRDSDTNVGEFVSALFTLNQNSDANRANRGREKER